MSIGRTLTRARRVLQSAVVWFYLSACGGAVLMLIGVYLLIGTGWMLIGGGVYLLVLAWFIRVGLTHG